jgi:hypothetical protein
MPAGIFLIIYCLVENFPEIPPRLVAAFYRRKTPNDIIAAITINLQRKGMGDV